MITDSDLRACRSVLAALASAAVMVWGVCLPAALVYAGVILG